MLTQVIVISFPLLLALVDGARCPCRENVLCQSIMYAVMRPVEAATPEDEDRQSFELVRYLQGSVQYLRRDSFRKSDPCMILEQGQEEYLYLLTSSPQCERLVIPWCPDLEEEVKNATKYPFTCWRDNSTVHTRLLPKLQGICGRSSATTINQYNLLNVMTSSTVSLVSLLLMIVYLLQDPEYHV